MGAKVETAGGVRWAGQNLTLQAEAGHPTALTRPGRGRWELRGRQEDALGRWTPLWATHRMRIPGGFRPGAVNGHSHCRAWGFPGRSEGPSVSPCVKEGFPDISYRAAHGDVTHKSPGAGGCLRPHAPSLSVFSKGIWTHSALWPLEALSRAWHLGNAHCALWKCLEGSSSVWKTELMVINVKV